MALAATSQPAQAGSSPGGNFDNLESLSEAESAPAEESAVSTDVSEPSTEVSPDPDTSTPNVSLDTSEAEDASSEVSESGDEPSEDAGGETQETLPATETIKAADGTEYSAETVFQKKVDGKVQDVSLKDLLDNYSGKQAIQTRFAEANTIKQKAEALERNVKADMEVIKSSVQRFFAASQNGHFRDAIDALCELTGTNPEQAWNEFQRTSRESARIYNEMSPEERAQAEIKQEAQYWQRVAQRNAQKPDPVKENAQKLDELKKKFSLDNKDLREAENLILTAIENKQYNALKGREFSKEDLDVENVANEAINIRLWRQIDSFLEKNLPEQRNNDQFKMEVLRDTRQYGLTESDWHNLLKEIRASGQKPGAPKVLTTPKKAVTSKLAERINKSNNAAGKKQVTTRKPGKALPQVEEDPVSFDEI